MPVSKQQKLKKLLGLKRSLTFLLSLSPTERHHFLKRINLTFVKDAIPLIRQSRPLIVPFLSRKGKLLLEKFTSRRVPLSTKHRLMKGGFIEEEGRGGMFEAMIPLMEQLILQQIFHLTNKQAMIHY